jgi:isopentenyl-diphosphate delta-isomerase
MSDSPPTAPADATDTTESRDRKAEHLQLAERREMQARENYFHNYAFEHRALPEIDLAEVDPSVSFLGTRLEAPLLISCMTGGTGKAESVNRNLARAAERAGIAVGVGSQRKALEQPEQVHTFQVREHAPSVPLLGNLGAVQFNYGYGQAECEAAVEMIDADALALHLNPLQEAIQPEGDRDFSTLLPKMGEVAETLSVPVIAKEIGCGISGAMARKLVDHGIDMIDTAGQGGTSWARIEAERADDVELGDLFANWGVPTPLAIQQVSEVPGTTVIGSGGVRSGVDVAKAFALGADLVGMASPFLKAAMESEEAVMNKIERTVRELRIAMFCVGARSISELQNAHIFERT